MHVGSSEKPNLTRSGYSGEAGGELPDGVNIEDKD